MAKRGRPKIRPDCDLAFVGEHFDTRHPMIKKHGRNVSMKARKEPTRVNGNGKPVFLCPKGWTESKGFLTCNQVKRRGLCQPEGKDIANSN
jgi:hypothetical protein